MSGEKGAYDLAAAPMELFRALAAPRWRTPKAGGCPCSTSSADTRFGKPFFPRDGAPIPPQITRFLAPAQTPKQIGGSQSPVRWYVQVQMQARWTH